MLDQAHPISIGHSRDSLLEEIGPAPELTLVRGLGNRGDDLILAGTRRLLAGHVYREIGIDELEAAEGDTALLLGSGAWCRPYHERMPTALGVVESRFDRVIVLPSSFDVAEDRVRAALDRSRATFFAREAESYRRIAGLCHARVAHDCAFFFDFGEYQQPGSGTLDAFRTDAEAASEGALPAGNDDISVTAPSLHDWLMAIAGHARVRTDRAHVMIAAALMGKEVEYAPGSYFKNDAVAATLPSALAVATRIDSGRAAPAPRTDTPPVAPARERLLAAARRGPVAPPVRQVDGGSRVCAAILTRDRPEHAPWSVRSVNSSGPGVRSLVLDNNSDPRARMTLDVLAENEDRCTVQHADRNLGCAGGRQLAATFAGEELILFLDDDAELLPGALELLVAELDAHPETQAVSPLVADPEGRVFHCGGSLELSADFAHFTLDGLGRAFDDAGVPASGQCDWIPGTAALVRRSLLEACPIDPAMTAYYEDNDWCLRVARLHREPFRRCREALAIHHGAARTPPTAGLARRDSVVQRIAAHARFLEVHGVLLHSGAHELRDLLDPSRPLDPATARLLLRLVTSYGPDWLLAEWVAGDLATVLARVAREREQRAALAAEARGNEEERAWLRQRHETLLHIEAGGWWRLRGRLLPVLRAADWARRTAGRVVR